MRALVLGLILANILYWTWASNIDAPAAAVEPALDPDLPLLELIPRTVAVVDAVDTTDDAMLLLPKVGSDGVLSVDSQANDQTEDLGDTEIGDVSATVQVSENTQPVSTPTVSASAPPPNTLPPGETSERGSESKLIAQNLLAAVDPVTHPARCVGVGPFVSLRQASEAAALINQAGLTTSQRVEESQVWVGHWVHLPSYPSRAAAVEVVEKLRAQGIKDIYIEPSGELKNTISLGLFTKLASAEIRAGKVRKLGDVKPQIRNRSRDGLVYWIDVPLDAGVSLDTGTLPHNSSQKLELKSVDCPPLSANG